MKNEYFEYARRVADELEKYAAGTVTDDGGEPLSMWDYLADALDVEYTIDSNLEYKSARIYVTLGGPTVWVDTAEHAVKLAWGTDREEYPLDLDTCDYLDEVLEDEYNARRGC